ncbi:pyridoxamine 5'-phosphate oxidase family protein [Paenibacillus soyae]|uniref:Pyridoxamine 5'-phosphate oxidase family protein n=1 Tax=Paenibacillus soyae TaxID=2969249 RepID=A0A9X2MTU3_9BACL|nr:pyridoxamine 5'-phosphate oxidase family protein [Paenibacillus soyae]MCR2805636.1 pyridoxamine 5'-phosphate oxidase family protein [Paenibacillus soyae]
MTSVYHSGELAVQRLARAEAAAEQNGRSIRDAIPKGVAAFLTTLSFVIVSSADADGNVWCSMITGNPGFLHALDERTIDILYASALSDPLYENLRTDRNIGLLAIDLEKRVRVRINGTAALIDGGLRIRAAEVYGNCPKYIQKRRLRHRPDHRSSEQTVYRSDKLSSEQMEWIRRSDTFFIGSRSKEGKTDASHRGGAPGFVRFSDDRTLVFPDYYGNSMFNTLGNIYSQPNAGLLFIDFDSGHTLQLTGHCEIVWNEEQIKPFPHAERLVRFDITEVQHTAADSKLYWELLE